MLLALTEQDAAQRDRELAEHLVRLRTAVLAELAEARAGFERALDPDQSNVFIWHGEEFWVDRVRCFVIPGPSAGRVEDSAWRRKDTLPRDDYEAGELLDVYAGEYQLEDTGELLRMLARVIAGVTGRVLCHLAAAKLINLAIAQPKINPAFGPLFWLFLADDMGAGPVEDYSKNLFVGLGSMIYLQIDYPELTPPPGEVRRAQIDFLERMLPGTTDASCQQLSDAEWAARCEDQLRLHQHLVDDRIFCALLCRIGSLQAPGARPFL